MKYTFIATAVAFIAFAALAFMNYDDNRANADGRVPNFDVIEHDFKHEYMHTNVLHDSLRNVTCWSVISSSSSIAISCIPDSQWQTK
jgi:hypothetical protein